LPTGPKPEVHHFEARPEELEYVGARLKELASQRPAEHICLVARTKKLLTDDYQPLLARLCIECAFLDQKQEGGGVRLATIHRVKGLEFPVMFLAAVNARYMSLHLTAELDILLPRPTIAPGNGRCCF
jgi:ATP-dependent exoDNAse (exonuclease V) beta subunit